MCRLFGFRSTIQSQVHRSLVAADNAISKLSNVHPDGWGVAYYVDGAPHVTKSPTTALSDQIFHRVSGVVASETVLAHVRRATVGERTVLNTHPFQHGRWTFAHNGEIRAFAEHRATLLDEIAPRLRRFILGETDSEVLFFHFLTELLRFGPSSDRHDIEHVIEALRATTGRVRELCDGAGDDEKSKLTVIVTDGQCMVGIQGHKELFWSTHKRRCADRDHCPNLAPQCESAATNGHFVNHLVLSSEPLAGENVWNEMKLDDVVAVDARMRLVLRPLERRSLRVAS